MIRGFFRLIGLLLLAGGFIFVVYDGARWVADQTLRFTRFGQFWNDVHQSSQQAFRTWVEANVPWLWNSVVKVVLDQPVFAVMGILGILLMIGCVGYLIQSFAAFLLPNLQVNIALFTFWGEVLFPLWLVIRGVNVEQWKKRALEVA